MEKSHKHLFTYKLSLIGAILVATLLVGSILWTFNLSPWASRGATNPQAAIYLVSQVNLIKMDARTHEVLWQQPFRGEKKVILVGNVLYMMQQLYPPETSILAIDAKSGHTRWTHPFVAQPGMDIPRVIGMKFAKDQLYISVGNIDPSASISPIQIYVLNTSDGSQRSVYPASNDANNVVDLTTRTDMAIGGGTPDRAIGDAMLAMNTGGQFSSLQVYDLASGKPRWHVSIDGDALGVQSVQIIDGLLYASISINTGQSLSHAYLAVYKADTGDLVWQSNTFVSFNDVASIDFTVDHHILYFGTKHSPARDFVSAGEVYAYDVLHKKMLWAHKVDGGVQSPPVVQNGLVYVNADTERGSQPHIVALTAQNGEIKWQQTFHNNRILRFSVSNSIVYVYIYVFSAPQNSWSRLDALKVDNGDVQWDIILPSEYIIDMAPTE